MTPQTLTPAELDELRRLERAWRDAPEHTQERAARLAEWEFYMRRHASEFLDAWEERERLRGILARNNDTYDEVVREGIRLNPRS